MTVSLPDETNGIVLVTPELKPVSEMSEREMLEEVVLNMRMVREVLAAFQEMGPAQLMARMFSSRK